MKKELTVWLMAGVLSVGLLSACSLPFAAKEEAAEDAGAEIRADLGKVKVSVGGEEEIEIENYEDLKKLDFEVEDESIATVSEDDDGVYVVNGVSEGKTTVTFTAKDCEDLVIKITVEGIDPAASVGFFELDQTEITVDYYDQAACIYIKNWDEIVDSVKDTLGTVSSDEDLLRAYFDEEGRVWLNVYGDEDGYATVTIKAEGFEPAYVTVECTHANDTSAEDHHVTSLEDSYYGCELAGTLQERYNDECWWFYILDGYEVNTTTADNTLWEFENRDDLTYYSVYGYMPFDIYCYMGVDGFTIDDNPDYDYDDYEFTYEGTGFSAPNERELLLGKRVDGNMPEGYQESYFIFFMYEDIINGVENGFATDYVVIELPPEIGEGLDYAGAYEIATHIFNY